MPNRDTYRHDKKKKYLSFFKAFAKGVEEEVVVGRI